MKKMVFKVLVVIIIISLLGCQSGILSEKQENTMSKAGEIHNKLLKYVSKSPYFMSKDIDTLFTIQAYQAYKEASREFLINVEGVSANEVDDAISQLDSILFSVGALKLDNGIAYVENFNTDYLDQIYSYIKNNAELSLIEKTNIDSIYSYYKNGMSFEQIDYKIDQIPLYSYPNDQILKLMDFISVFESSSEYWPSIDPEILRLPGGIVIILWDTAGAIIGGICSGGNFWIGALMGCLFSMIGYHQATMPR